MPYKSVSQQKKFHAMAAKGEISKDTVKHWDEATKKAPGGFKALPERVKKMEKKSFWSGFSKRAMVGSPADADVAGMDVQNVPAESPPPEMTQSIPAPPKAIQKWNHQGGIEPRNPQEIQLAQSVNHVTLPTDVQGGGASCATCVHFNPTNPQSGEGVCSNPQFGLATTTRMTCTLWDSPGAGRAWDTVDTRNAEVNQMEGAVGEAVDPMSESNMVDSQMAEADPNMTNMGSNPQQPKPQDSAETPVKPEKKKPAKPESKKDPAGTQVHVHVGSEKKADDRESTVGRIVGLLRKNPALLKNLAKGTALVGAGAAAGHFATKKTEKPAEEKTANLATHGAELAGLATLAAPTVQEMRGKHMSEKGRHVAELGGLGILAAPSAIEAGKAVGHKLEEKIPTLAKMFAHKG